MRKTRQTTTRGAGLVFVAAVLLAIGCGEAEQDKAVQASAPPVAQETESLATKRVKAEKPAPIDDGLVEDDGKTLWASPTSGEPINAELVPGGSDLIVWLRPQRLLATEQGRRAWRALGPRGERARASIEATAGASIETIDRLVVGVTAGASYESVEATTVVDPEPTEELPLLQREIEQLLATSDSERALTIVFAPRFMLGSGGSLVTGGMAPVRDLLLNQVSDQWKAIALSVDFGSADDSPVYWELRLMTDAATPASQASRALEALARQWPAALQAVNDSTNTSPHAAPVVSALPKMAGVLSSYARRGAEGRQAVLSGYLPSDAGHNLLLAAELLIAETASPAPVAVAAVSDQPELGLAEKLLKPVSIAFERESLETAVTILSQTLAVPITIEGRDLQLEGITRNQMLGLDVRSEAAEAALIEVLRRANPDPLATGPTDPRQKLVYVVRDGGLVITTRAAAKRRGEPLPDGFLD